MGVLPRHMSSSPSANRLLGGGEDREDDGWPAVHRCLLPLSFVLGGGLAGLLSPRSLPRLLLLFPRREGGGCCLGGRFFGVGLQAEAAAAKAQLGAMRDGFVTAGAPIDATRISAEAARAEIERLTVTSHQRRACPARCCRGGPVRR